MLLLGSDSKRPSLHFSWLHTSEHLESYLSALVTDIVYTSHLAKYAELLIVTNVLLLFLLTESSAANIKTAAHHMY